MADLIEPPAGQFLREEFIRGGMDLLFFANTRHLKRADARLASLGLGRAHHRVLYFVKRRPALRVSHLLDVLSVTKQSFARIAHHLSERGFKEVRQGQRDRRERLLFLTQAGEELEADIFNGLHENVLRAYHRRRSRTCN